MKKKAHALTIGMPHLRGEAALGRIVGIVLGERKPCIEEATLATEVAWGEIQKPFPTATSAPEPWQP